MRRWLARGIANPVTRAIRLARTAALHAITSEWARSELILGTGSSRVFVFTATFNPIVHNVYAWIGIICRLSALQGWVTYVVPDPHLFAQNVVYYLSTRTPISNSSKHTTRTLHTQDEIQLVQIGLFVKQLPIRHNNNVD